MLLPRLITAIIGIPLVLFSIYWGGLPFFAMVLCIIVLSINEYFYLANSGGYKSQGPIVGIILGVLLYVSMFLSSTQFGLKAQSQTTPFIICCLLLIIFIVQMAKSRRERTIETLGVTFFGAFFIPWTIGHLVLIRNMRPFGMEYIAFLFISIWLIDTGAYAVGKRFGRFKLAQTISPNKTIEGAVGGCITALLVSIIAYFIFLKNAFTMSETLIIGLIIAVFAQFSDLSESLLKRDVGVKDSANLLPGHGGMLDRFDSFLFAAPLFYYYLTVFKGK